MIFREHVQIGEPDGESALPEKYPGWMLKRHAGYRIPIPDSSA